MEKFFAQHLYSLKNINNYYLSPYCQVLMGEDGLILERSDLDKQLFMPMIKQDKVINLFEKLLDGISLEGLINELGSFMSEEDIKEWIKYGIQGGILE